MAFARSWLTSNASRKRRKEKGGTEGELPDHHARRREPIPYDGIPLYSFSDTVYAGADPTWVLGGLESPLHPQDL
mgnify:CR=1 FL=1